MANTQVVTDLRGQDLAYNTAHTALALMDLYVSIESGNFDITTQLCDRRSSEGSKGLRDIIIHLAAEVVDAYNSWPTSLQADGADYLYEVELLEEALRQHFINGLSGRALEAALVAWVEG